MLSAEDKRFIQNEIVRHLNLILSAKSGESTTSTETIDNLFPGMSSIKDRPIMHPYGFVSRAPKGIINVTGQHGAHPGNRMVLGHRDKDRPDVDEGEATIYNLDGFRVRLKKDGIYLAKGNTEYYYVLGDPLVELLGTLLDELIKHTHASPGTPPSNAAQFTNLKTNYITNDQLSSKSDGGLS